jgi:hypothetical protein
MFEEIATLVAFIEKHGGKADKGALARMVQEQFALTKDRSVFYSVNFAIRFSTSSSVNFSNTVLSLSNLRKFDGRPFIVCVVLPNENICLLANTTFLRKITHSSQELRVNNIRGSFNGSDIMRVVEGIQNRPANFARLFAIHEPLGFDENLSRLVEATNDISPTGAKFAVTDDARSVVLEAPARAHAFVDSEHAKKLAAELDALVTRYEREILLASFIENVNVRGRIVEYLIAGDDDALRQQLRESLQSGARNLPAFKTRNSLGDFERDYEAFDTRTDIKTKLVVLNSNPKAYNLDKMLQFLTTDRSVFMFYFVAIDPGLGVKTALVSMFQRDLLASTIFLRHWAGRNSRGVTQFDGHVISQLVANQNVDIDTQAAKKFLTDVMAL